MRQLSFDEIAAMKGNGSSMRTVLKYFMSKGASVFLIYDEVDNIIERYFLVKYEDLEIPLRAYKLNFYSIYNSALSIKITSDKRKSHAILGVNNIPTPATELYTTETAAESFLNHYKTIVVKPRMGSHGDGITVGVEDMGSLQKAVSEAKTIDTQVLLQQYVTGEDHRLLFIDYKFVAAVRRQPATVTGDGTHTVRELVEASNLKKKQLGEAIRSGDATADETRGSISPTPLEEIIAARGEALLETVPTENEIVQLVDKANVSLGGQTYDVTDNVSTELTDKLSSMLKSISLPFCGIDVLSSDIASPLSDNKSYVIELNSAPGLRLHELPAYGQPRQVCAMMAESLITYYRNLK